MADFTPVGTQIKPPQGMSLGEMVNMANAAQQYQQAQQMNPIALETARSQLSRLNQLTPLEVRGKAAETKVSEETTEPRISQSKSLASKGETEASSAKMDLLNKTANTINSGTVSMINDPDVINAEQNPQTANIPKLINKLRMYGMSQANNAGIHMDQVGEILAPTMQIAANEPGSLRQHLKNQLQSQMDAHARATLMQPSGTAVSTGAGGYVASQNIFGPQGQGQKLPGTEFTSQLPPGSRYESTGRADLNGNPTAYVKDANGKILGEVTIPAGVQAAPAVAATNKPMMVAPTPAPTAPAAPANAPARIRAGESPESYKASSELRVNARQAAAQTPMQQFTANQIIDLAGKAKTGVGAETLANIAGKLAIVPWTGNTATYFDNLGHYMTLQQASLAKSAGLSGTDQANQLAGQLSGTTNWTEDAIQSTARVNRALSTAASMFNNGIENRFAVTKDPLAANDFQSQWSKTADINAIRLHDAIVNKDIAGIKEVIKAVDPQSMKLKDPLQSPNVQLLLKKWDVMNKLVKGQ